MCINTDVVNTEDYFLKIIALFLKENGHTKFLLLFSSRLTIYQILI